MGFILRIKLAATAAVLAMTTASIVALTGGAAETVPEPTPQPPALQAEPVLLVAEHDSTYQPVQMTAEPTQEPEPVEEEDENEKIEAALLEQGYLHEEIPLDFDLQCHLITVCEEYGVPQSVALGVIQAESSFTATASNGSCYGYMQINSINSEWLSEKIGVTDLTDPYQNIRSGVFILSDLYAKTSDVNTGLGKKADKVAKATNGNFAALDADGNLKDSGKKAADFVAAEAGKRLMTDAEGAKLGGVAEGATKVEASETNGNVKINGVDTKVYTEPTDVVHGAIATDTEVTEMLNEVFAATV